MHISRKILILTLLLSAAWAQYPVQWVVNAHDFEYSMTLTGELVINDQLQTETSSAVAVFHDGECRGVVEGTQVGDEVIYFLLIYGNTQGDSLDFQAWDATIGNVVLLNEQITFSSGSALGEVDTPYPFSGTNTVSFIQAFGDTFEQAEDTENTLPFDILGNDVYDRSLAMVVSFPVASLHGALFENGDQTFTYVSDLNFFGQDSFQYRVSHAYGADSAWVQINVTPVDDPLAEFHLVDPVDNAIFDETASSIQTFSWEIPEDYDGDPITYSLNVYDSGNLDTSYFSDTNSLQVTIEDLPRNTWLDWLVVAYDGWGSTTSSDFFALQISSLVDIDPDLEFPESFSLQQNFPNPFNPTTTIRYGLPERSVVNITIHDIQGREVMSWTFAGHQAGWHDLQWKGSNMFGVEVAAGMYFTKLRVGPYTQTIKMLYLK